MNKLQKAMIGTVSAFIALQVVRVSLPESTQTTTAEQAVQVMEQTSFDTMSPKDAQVIIQLTRQLEALATAEEVKFFRSLVSRQFAQGTQDGSTYGQGLIEGLHAIIVYGEDVERVFKVIDAISDGAYVRKDIQVLQQALLRIEAELKHLPAIHNDFRKDYLRTDVVYDLLISYQLGMKLKSLQDVLESKRLAELFDAYADIFISYAKSQRDKLGPEHKAILFLYVPELQK